MNENQRDLLVFDFSNPIAASSTYCWGCYIANIIREISYSKNFWL